MDPLNLDKTISTVDSTTIPEAAAKAAELIDKLAAVFDRLDGATITVTVKLSAGKS